MREPGGEVNDGVKETRGCRFVDTSQHTAVAKKQVKKGRKELG